MQRSTKIVATLGPASSELDVLRRMIAAGVDVVRMNFSHGKHEDHLNRAELVRQAARELERTVGLMVDLQGDPQPPSTGDAEGEVDNGGRKWRWTRVVAPTEDPRLLRVDLVVNGDFGQSPAALTFMRPTQ